MNQDSPIQRQCMIQDHNRALIVMRCTQQKCQQPTKWMCLKCKNLHADHLIQCLHIEELTQFLKGDKEKYIVKDRQNIQKEILQVLSRQRDLFLSTHQKLEKLYVDCFKTLDNEEKAIQDLYDTIETKQPLLLTEEEFSTLQTKQIPQEALKFQENQLNIFNRLRTCNEQIDKIAKSLQELVAIKIQHENVIVLFYNEAISKDYKYSGNLKFGVKFGQWNISNDKGELIGGGQYNSSGNKHGQWVDIELAKSGLAYIQSIGKYNEGKQVDKFDIKDSNGKIIGGGQYNSSGNKHGQWVDIEFPQSKSGLGYHKYIGKYNEGLRVNKWNIYNQDGKKIEEITYAKTS